MKIFSNQTLEFIALASRQKSPTWLDKNRSQYEAVLVEPMKELLTYVARVLGPNAPGYRFPLRSIARIKRTADRAKAQGMYKDWIGVSVSRDSGSRYEDLPGLYFHLSPEDFFSAGGLYMSSARQTKQIRSWIDKDPSELEGLFKDRTFKKHFKELGNEQVLKTKPRDYPLDHPRIEWLKLTGFYVWRPYTKKQLYSKAFRDLLVADWEQVLRLNGILDRYTRTWPKETLQRGNGTHKTKLLDLDGVQAPQVNWSDE